MRKFGLEIEFLGYHDGMLTALREEGLSRRVQRANYSANSATEWLIKPDGSLGMSGGECVSPPLDFDDPDQRGQVDRAVKALRESGARPDGRAGIHVHVDASDFDIRQLTLLVRTFYKFEDVLYRIASSGHRTIRHSASTYAPPMSDARVRLLAKAKTASQLRTAWYGTDQITTQHSDASRYCGFNLHSWFYRGTIEYRLFNSSMNEMRIQTYIATCVALVEDARRGNVRSINKTFALGGMVDGTTNQAAALHRFQQVLRYEAGMSVEDMSNLGKLWRDSVPQGRFAMAR